MLFFERNISPGFELRFLGVEYFINRAGNISTLFASLFLFRSELKYKILMHSSAVVLHCVTVASTAQDKPNHQVNTSKQMYLPVS